MLAYFFVDQTKKQEVVEVKEEGGHHVGPKPSEGMASVSLYTPTHTSFPALPTLSSLPSASPSSYTLCNLTLLL